MIKRLLSLVFVSVIFFYWFQQKYSSPWNAPDLAGVWKMENDACIELRNDGSCRVVKFGLSGLVALEEDQYKTLTLSGKWNYKGYFQEEQRHYPSDKLCLEIHDPRRKITFCLFFSIPLSYFSGEKRPSRIYMHIPGKERYEFRRLD